MFVGVIFNQSYIIAMTTAIKTAPQELKKKLREEEKVKKAITVKQC